MLKFLRWNPQDTASIPKVNVKMKGVMQPGDWINIGIMLASVLVPAALFMAAGYRKLHSDHANTREKLVKVETEIATIKADQIQSQNNVAQISTIMTDMRIYIAEQFASLKTTLGMQAASHVVNVNPAVVPLHEEPKSV